MTNVPPKPLKATRNWADMPWPKAMRRRMESVPQKRAKVMSAAFFRRFRYSLQKKRGRVGFILFPQGLDGVGRRGRPGRDHPGDDADDEEDQDGGDDDERVEDGDADKLGEPAGRHGFGHLENAGREAETDGPAEEHDHERFAEELPEDRPAAGADRQLDAEPPRPLVHDDPHDRSDADAAREGRERGAD